MAEAGEVQAVARKLRAKGLSDEQVIDNLRSSGYSETEARQAVVALGRTSPAPPKPATTPRGGRRPGPTRARPASSTTPGLPAPSMPSRPSLSLTPPKSLTGGDLGGFVAGLFAYVLFLNYVRHGKDGVTDWFRAKFLNVPSETIPRPTTKTLKVPANAGRGGEVRPGVGPGGAPARNDFNPRQPQMPGDFGGGS